MPEGFAGDGELTAPPSPIPAEAEPDPAVPRPVLEFDIDAADLPRLLKHPALVARRQGRPRSAVLRTVWHDTATAAFQADGLALAEQSGLWRLERLVPNGHGDWLPAAPAPILAQAAARDQLGHRNAAPLVPVAAFTGTSRLYALAGGTEPARLEVLEGTLRGVTQDHPACRVVLSGPGPAMAALARELAETAPLRVPAASLAACAVAVAHGTTPAPRHTGTPEVSPGMSVDQALVLTTAHLADVILHWARLAPAGDAPEPVHQMRVAVRRLRSALAIFRRAMPGLDLGSVAQDLKTLACVLGEARDWDVFLAETGAAVQRAFPADRRLAAMTLAAARRREAAYTALRAHLASPAWRHAALNLALLPTLRPWDGMAVAADAADWLPAPAGDYAAHALNRAFRHLAASGDELAALDATALHDLRKRAKKFRYATEFFAPLFAARQVRRFLAKLVDVQEALGTLNDGAVAGALMAQLGTGADRAFASGVVQGYVAARSAPALQDAQKAWRKLTRHEPFWS